MLTCAIWVKRSEFSYQIYSTNWISQTTLFNSFVSNFNVIQVWSSYIIQNNLKHKFHWSQKQSITFHLMLFKAKLYDLYELFQKGIFLQRLKKIEIYINKSKNSLKRWRGIYVDKTELTFQQKVTWHVFAFVFCGREKAKCKVSCESSDRAGWGKLRAVENLFKIPLLRISEA